MSQGNIVNWKSSKWEVTNMRYRKYDDQQVCNPKPPKYVILPRPMTFDRGEKVCRMLRGRIAVVKTKKDDDEIAELLNATNICAAERMYF